MSITLTGFSQTVFLLSMAVVNLALFFRWVSLGQETTCYRRVALAFVSIALLLQIPILLQGSENLAPYVVAVFTLGLFKLYLTTGVGLHYAQALQIPNYSPGGSAPIVRSSLQQLLVTTSQGWVLAVGGSLILMLTATAVLFWLFNAQLPEQLLENAPEHSPSELVLVLTVLAGAFAEEIVFRLGLQNWLSYSWGHSTRSHWIAVLVTTTIWTSGHAGMIDPDWVKFAQMFVMGIVLGALNQRFGIVACITVHGLFNVIVTLQNGWLPDGL